MTLTVGSLFSGIGGLELGLERAGMKTVWQVESDGYAQKVLEKHWPNVERYGDVREVHARNACAGCDNCVYPVDLVCGGFPCQDISKAGKGRGIGGDRSALWFEFCRVVCELRPRFVLVENVPALAFRGLDRVLGDLAASGYDARWDCIPAAALGAHHLRDRIFIVAHADGHRLKAIFASERPSPNTHHRERKPKAAPRGRPDIEFVTGKPSRWRTEPDVGRVADGIPSRVDRLRCLGNAAVPQVAEFIGRRIVAFEERRLSHGG